MKKVDKITQEGFREYLDVFHSTLTNSAEEFLSVEQQRRLLHLSLLPARIVGYLSTQYGVAYEYFPDSQTSIEVVRGSATAEELLVQAPNKLKWLGTGLLLENCVDSGIFRCHFDSLFPFRMTGTRTNISIGEVKVRNGLWTRTIHYAELYGDRRQDNWSSEKAISRAKDEVLAALVELNRASDRRVSLEEYISNYKKKTVLVLGSYSGDGTQRLEKILSALRELNYDPLLVCDVPDHPHQNLEQKVALLGSLSRFVVVDDSEKSGHIAELEICKINHWLTIILRARGVGSTMMTAAASVYSKVILEKNYEPSTPLAALAEAVSWAEEQLQKISGELTKVYPWRW